MANEIPADLIAYLARRVRARNDRFNDVLESFSPTERELIKEAAVMGYVHGKMAGRDAKIPPDAEIVWIVITGCLDQPDLYPLIGGADDGG